MGYHYDVMRGGDAQIFDPQNEITCPLRPKVAVRSRSEVDIILRDVFERVGTDSTFSANIRAILGRTIAGHRMCGYHLARAMASATVEAVGGTSGDEYDEFLVPLCGVTDDLAGTTVDSAWLQEVHTSLGYFLAAAGTGGLRKFMHLYRETEKSIRGLVPPRRPFRRALVVMSVVAVMLVMMGAATIALGLGGWLGQPGITTEPVSTPEDNPFMPPVGDDRTEVTMPARSDGTLGSSTPQSPSTPQALTTSNPTTPAVPTQAPMLPPPEQRPVELRPLRPPADHPPVITGISTYQEDPLVYFSLRFTDVDGDAEGFGFRGVNGAGWAEENIPFTSPSYGRVSPGRVDYPFNHGCGQDNEYESDVEAWIYDSEGNRSESIIVHLSCS